MLEKVMKVSGPIPMNLQMFGNGDDDLILPDDFQGTEDPAVPGAGESDLGGQEVTDPEPQPGGEGEQETTDPAPQQTIKVKYNHQEMELPYEEAVQHIQKGMNYDKTVERLKALENDPRFQKFDRVKSLADRYQMNEDEFLDALQQQYEANEIQKLAQRENVPVEIAERLYKLEQRDSERQRREQESERSRQQEAKQKTEINEFLQSFPDMKAQDIPQAVWDYKDKTGKSLTDAMMWHENQELKKQVLILRQNEQNLKKAPLGGVTSHGSVETAAEDDFLRGFNSI